MPVRGERIKPAHEWRQLEFRIPSGGQRSYKPIRLVVLFGHSPAVRATETRTGARTLYQQVASFVLLPKVEKHRTLPAHIRQTILDVKREHPPLNVNEIRTIC